MRDELTRDRGWAVLGTALALIVGIVALVSACGADGTLTADDLLVAELGGDTTAFTATRTAFSQSARNLTNEERRTFEVGDSFFTQNWVTAPASTDARDGLGPLFNAQSCSSCHVLDGRGRPPEDDDDGERGLLLRLSIPGEGPHGGPLPEPTYGDQLQDRAVQGVAAEGTLRIRYQELAGTYPDGDAYTLRVPVYEVVDPAYGVLSASTLISPRVAPVVFGVGLLEAIPEDVIRGLADPDDEDGDGVSGRVNTVWNEATQSEVLGRFGWKANQPSVAQQTAGAFLGDIGITSPLHPDQICTASAPACVDAADGGSPEIPADRLAKVVFYSQTLAVPAMRDIDDDIVREGARLFLAAGCSTCHVPTFTTGDAEIEALSDQRIFPYTDLLLHDMGEGLADGRPDFDATGSEWRTPPLWGIGLVETVNGHTMYLHDGRARSLEEAILWHGGEGSGARDAFKALAKDERDALLAFLRAL